MRVEEEEEENEKEEEEKKKEKMLTVVDVTPVNQINQGHHECYQQKE